MYTEQNDACSPNGQTHAEQTERRNARKTDELTHKELKNVGMYGMSNRQNLKYILN